MLLLACFGGCDRSGTAGRHTYKAKVETIRLYDVELGPDASPEDVAYVLLRVVRDKREAVRTNDRATSEKMTEALVSLAAPEKILSEYQSRVPSGAVNLLNVDKTANEAARTWGPSLAHYTDCFKTDRAEAAKVMTTLRRSDQQAVVMVPVYEKTYASSATLQVKLIKEQGYWRVWGVAYLSPSEAKRDQVVQRVFGKNAPRGASQPASRPASQPVSQPATQVSQP